MKSFTEEYGRPIVVVVIIMALLGIAIAFAFEGSNRIESIYDEVTNSVPKIPTITLTDITGDTDGGSDLIRSIKVETDSNGEITASLDSNDLNIIHIDNNNDKIYVGNNGFNSGKAKLTVTVGETDEYMEGSSVYEISYSNPMITASIVSESPCTAKYVVHWILPSGSTVNSFTIYRGHTPDYRFVNADIMIKYGTRFDVTGCNYRDYTYTLNLTELTSDLWQHCVSVVTYTLNGETHQLIAGDRKVKIL